MIQINPAQVRSLRLDDGSTPEQIYEVFQQIEEFTNLRSLELASIKVSDHVVPLFSSLGSCKWLQKVTLSQTSITADGLSKLFVALKNCQMLDNLAVICSQIDDSCMEHLAQLSRLRRLNLNLNRDITDAGFEKLMGLFQLVDLDLRNTDIGDDAMSILAQFPYLRHLWFEGSSVLTGKGLVNLSSSKSVECISLCRMDRGIRDVEKYDDEGLKALTRMKMLFSLTLCQTEIYLGDFYKYIEDFQSLRKINIEDKYFEAEALQKKFPQIEIHPILQLGGGH